MADVGVDELGHPRRDASAAGHRGGSPPTVNVVAAVAQTDVDGLESLRTRTRSGPFDTALPPASRSQSFIPRPLTIDLDGRGATVAPRRDGHAGRTGQLAWLPTGVTKVTRYTSPSFVT